MKIGDIIKFGSYPQDSNDSELPIEWLVLDVKGSEALLISRYGIDCKQYNHNYTDITWEDCDLRKWLNNDFIKSAFSEEEAKAIKVSLLKNKGGYQTDGGMPTRDCVFCLSIEESEQYFSCDADRQCQPTTYARKQGAYSCISSYGCCDWWLRSPGDNQASAELIDSEGRRTYTNVHRDIFAVRPALRIECSLIKELQTQTFHLALRDIAILPSIRIERRQLKELQAQTYNDFLAIIKNGIKKGMIIPFGSYPQDSNDSELPIEWLVLDVKKPSLVNRLFKKDKKIEVLLISRYGLDCLEYNRNRTETTWEDSFLRRWLNNNFFISAFSEEDAKWIKISELKNKDNRKYQTQGGNDTKDRIFCLSITESEQYFSSDKDRQCRPTAYARILARIRARKWGNYYRYDEDYCPWRLRSPGINLFSATRVNRSGTLDLGGMFVDYDAEVIRPALRIILDEELERKISEEQELRQQEQERRQLKELQAQTYNDFLAIIKNGVKKGMIIPFGSYPQRENCYRTPIEWIVLDVKENEALLISRYGLDCKQYHHNRTKTTWEDCDLRKWLNNDFIKSSFSEEEAKKIKVSELKNTNNFKMEVRKDTKDRVFCLSIEESEQYFSCDADRQCQSTTYARNKGAWVHDNGCCCWWLRCGWCKWEPGFDAFQTFNNYKAIIVDTDGKLAYRQTTNHDEYYTVRPALRIICDEELERRQREEQEQEPKQLKERQAQTYKNFLPKIKTGIRKGMIIPFGSYPQNGNGCRVPIEWLVLDVNENEALLISRYGINYKQYNHNCTDITWEDCDLRKWLNNDFIKSAFSEEEAKAITVSELKNDDNREYRTRGGNDTKDHVFCLSITEAEQYFRSDYDRRCEPTAYVRNHGAYVKNDRCFWWLRSPGRNQDNAAYVEAGGSLYLYGCNVNYVSLAVRPALRIICNLLI